MTKNGKPLYVLGTGLSHDGSACLLKDGRICVAIEKERIIRQKHAGGNDSDAIQYCLEAERISINDLTLVVQNANFGMFPQGNEWFQGFRLLNDTVPVVTISHHLAHAYSAIGTSHFKEAAIMVIDGCGSSLDDCIDLDGAIVTEDPPKELRHLYNEKDSYYIFKDGKLTPILKDFSPWGASVKEYPMHPPTTLHSIGGLYSAVSMYVFTGIDDSGKLMGLAPYGRPGVYDIEIFDLRNGRIYVNYDWMHNFNSPCRDYDQFKRNFQYYADIAYWVQKEIERAVLYVFNSRYELAPSDRIAYAGGVALNAVANRYLLTNSKFKDIYIQPAAGDNGLAVGCAYYGWMEVLKKERILHNGSMSLGKTYQRQSIDNALAKYKDSLEYFADEDYIDKTAELLAEGKVIGWFQDGAEFGPRALGHRSILADPRKPEMRNFINWKIKFREDFRPFAPSVLLEDVSLYFDCDYESPYMILIAPVRAAWRKIIPSVTHMDHSARIQTVTQLTSPKYYQLLCAFKKITGISVMLNTSFNRRGMPIVETPDQAIQFFLNCDLDALVLSKYIIYKRPHDAHNPINITTKFIENARMALERNHDMAMKIGGTYQINIIGNRTIIIDLSRNKPIIAEGAPLKSPIAVMEFAESDLDTFWYDPQNESRKLFQAGKLKLEGSPAQALRLVDCFKLV